MTWGLKEWISFWASERETLHLGRVDVRARWSYGGDAFAKSLDLGEFNFGRTDIVLGSGNSTRPPVLSRLVRFGYGPGWLLVSRYVSRFHVQKSGWRTMDVGRSARAFVY